MHVSVLTAIAACAAVNLTICDAVSSSFEVTEHGRQFKGIGTIKAYQAVSEVQCAGECLQLGSQCGGFSFTRTKLCTISVLRLKKGLKDPSQVFVAEPGTLVYGKLTGEFKFFYFGLLIHFCIFDQFTLFVANCCSYHIAL